MSREDFYKQVAHFDWFYQYSDDHGVWMKGKRKEKEIESEARADPVKGRILKAWQDFLFNDGPEPEKSDFDLTD